MSDQEDADPNERCYVTDGYAVVAVGTRAQCESWVRDAINELRNAGHIPPRYEVFKEQQYQG